MRTRKKAYEILYKFSIDKDINLKEELEKVLPSFSKREDRALLTHITYGVVRHLSKLNWIIDRLLEGKKCSKKVRVLLQIGIYSFLEFERVPHYATVSELVEIAKQVERGRAYKFVNAILRKYLRIKDTITIPDDPSIKYSFPSWFVNRWKERLLENCEDFFIENNKIPPETIRVNTLKITPEELTKILYKEGVEKVEQGRWKDSLRIYGYPYIGDLPSYKMGYFTVQDEGAMLVSHILSPLPGETVLDLCASPGGKTFHIATLMRNRGKVYAVDIKDGILIEEGIKRLGISIVEFVQFDLRKRLEQFVGIADRVLLDAPCTGLGTIRRRPELKWKKSIDDIKRLSSLQFLLLKNASLYVKPGGVLVYSVCTLEEEETERVFLKFLHTSPEFSMEKVRFLYPHLYDTDGFFIARFRKKE